ncbi:MAG TPA: MCE family protein [Actinomycetota bacterium]|nr:MCE family protein [Actinomycetota bacterium]
MRMTRRLAVNLVTVLLLGVVTIGWLISNVVGNGVFNAPFDVVADFASSGGVFTNQEVTYRGVVVGKVGDLELNETGVDIHLLIDREWLGRIPSSVAAKVQSKSAVGEQYVNLTPSGGAGSMLADGDTIPRSQTELPVDFQQLLESLDGVLRDVPPDTVRHLTQELATGLRGRAGDISSILDSLAKLSKAFASVAPQQKRLLSNATVAGRAFLNTKDEFARAIRAADTVFTGIGDEPNELRDMFRANDRLAREGSRLLARHGADLAAGIGSLADFVGYQYRERDGLVQSLVHVPQFLHAVEDASIPWRSADGRTFYRIRIGYVWDNVRSSWPCKYKLPDGYERQVQVRSPRTPITSMRCLPTPPAETTTALRGLVTDLRLWLRAHRDEASGDADTGIPAPLEPLFPPTPEPTVSPTPTTTPTPMPTASPDPAPTATSSP